jgi:GAF domain-containing protein
MPIVRADSGDASDEQRLETLAELVQAVTGSLELSEALERVAHAATQLIPDSAARIWVVESTRLVLRAEAGTRGQSGSGRQTELAFGEGLTGHAADTHDVVVVEEVLADPRAINVEWMRQQGFVSLAALPLVVRERLVGVATVLTRHHHQFASQELKFLRLFGSQAAIAIQNARLYTETARRRRANEALVDIASLISRSLSFEGTARRIADSIRDLLGAQSSTLYRLEPESGDLRLLASSGNRGPSGDGHALLPRGTGITGLAVAERRPVVTTNVLSDPRITLTPEARARIEQAPFRAALAVPMVAQDRVIGAMGVGNELGRAFDEEDIRLAQAFADQAAVALENARLFEEQDALAGALRSRQARVEALLEVGSELSRIQPVESLLSRIAEVCGRLFHSNSVTFRLVEGDELVTSAIWGHTEEILPSLGLKIGQSLTGIVAATGQPVVVRDPISDPRLIPAHREGYRRLGVRAFLGVPVKTGDQLTGVLSIRTSRESGFSADDVQLATAFASQAAIAIENARLFSLEQEREAYLSALLEINKKIGAVGPTEALLTSIAEEAARLLDVDNAGFRLLDGDELVVAGLAGTASETMTRPRLKIGESLSGRVLAEGKTLISDVATAKDLIPEHREADLRLGYVQVLVVPLRVGERITGVLNIRARRHVTRRDQEIAEAFADQAAIALENSRLYQELRRAFDELSQTQSQLAQAQKMEAVGLLAGGVAHDFNNLLMVITGRSELLLLRLRREDPVRQDVELIKGTAQRAADLTRQLLAFSRKQVLQPRILNLNAVVDGLAPMLERLIGEDIELRTALDPALGAVKADPGQIEQVIMNLVVNARDAMLGGGQLIIETCNVELDAASVHRRVGVQPGPHVMLAVTDNGRGMDEATRARIFEPFFTTKEVGKGTGLGLSTVHGIINQSGGTIWVYSEPGKGTTFKIYLPRTAEAAEEIGRGADAAPALGSETILLVEDEEGVRELVRDLLRERGYTVLEAGHGAEALDVARRHGGPIDLLLTDVVMPHMGEPELAERLGTLQPSLKVLYMSGYTERAAVHRGMLDPDAAYLQKPVTIDAVARRVREVLESP